MDAKKNKMCKLRLRRLRPEMLDKLKTKKGIAKFDEEVSSSSSDSEDEINVDDGSEKVSVKLRSPLALGNNKGFDPYVLLTEAQAALKLSSEKDFSSENKKIESGNLAVPMLNQECRASVKSSESNKKLSNYKKHTLCPPLEETNENISSIDNSNINTSIENGIYDLIGCNSDIEGLYNYNCNHVKPSSSSAVLALAPTDRRSSTGSNSSILSDNCPTRFSKLFENNCISVMDSENPPVALSKILSVKEFDPLAPQQILTITIKSVVSLAELSQRDDNIVCIDIDKRRILEFSAMSPEEKKNYPLNPYMDVSNIVVTHSDDEFLTFCLCENCEKYREFVIHIMVEQFKATHMVVMLLDVLIKSYGPMLKNITAFNKFEDLLNSNKEIYWITCGVIYHKKAEHLDFIYDEYLSDNMILVLFSSILMLNNPLLLLQILAFHVECVVKAYAEGFLEIVEPDKNKIPADEMINYILNGYDDLMRISEHVACYLFAFENDFLRKFSLTWKLLSQRLYQQHVHLHLTDTMLACIITLKEEELTSHHTELIKRYIQFDDIMNYVEKRWADVWIELNKFSLTEVERKRRKSLLDVYRIFDTVVQDAIGFSLQDSIDGNDFYDFRFLKNRRLAWKNIMSYTKLKWPDGFQPPNNLVVDDKCPTCNVSLEYHAESCKCITCSIAGGPMPPRRNADNKCSKCLAHEIVEKDVNFYDSKILNVCANDDFQNLVSKTRSNSVKRKNTALKEAGNDLYPTLEAVGEMLNVKESDKTLETMESSNCYHISWAVFNHLNNRKRYPYATIEEKYFCRDCKLPSCLLALKILNNEISPSLSQDLIHYYQPMSMSREELRSLLPSIVLYNRKLVASNNGLDLIDVHDLVVRIYWIFVISIYAIYFIDYDDNGVNTKEGVKKSKSSYLNVLELRNNDINVNVDKIIGDKDDTKFLEFLDKIKSLSPYNNAVTSKFEVNDNVNSGDIENKLDYVLKTSDTVDIPSQFDKAPSPIISAVEDKEESHQASELIPKTVEAQPRKSCKEKSKKCCFEHSEMSGDHCRENHSTKKRLKKDCNHVRINETRERLRKKLSQIVNARKNKKPLQLTEASQTLSESTSSAATENYPDARNIMENFLNPEELKLFQQYLPRPDFWEIQDFIASFDHIYTEASRSEEKKNLCECLQNLKTNSKCDLENTNYMKKIECNHQYTQQQQPLHIASQHEQQKPHNINQSKFQQLSSLEQTNKKSNTSNNSTRDASTSSHGTKSKERNSNTTAPIPSSKPANDLDFVSEICEIIDNYSKEQAKRKWIRETLSFIEGPAAGIGKKKVQPQTLNPKKAAKKAKQKQRKEEEKRIAELQDLRAQFYNIYFKEFSNKFDLKSLKANKKKDKKKINDLENNIKNLQRAKAKIETAILELIATVKQTNTEFKFPYLPTKEQQLAKMKELEGHDSKESEDTIKVRNLLHHSAKENNSLAASTSTSTFKATPTNNLNTVQEAYGMPYAHANHFPYNLGFTTPTASTPFGLMRPSPMCYSPPSTATVTSVHQQQQLSSDVGAGNAISDPSKRIVTIRRVNLPNVPEAQVTVTAKGSSPDKDKLLYTFINGQLIQTEMAPPLTIPQMPAVTPIQQSQMQNSVITPTQTAMKKLTAEHLSILPPSASKLSKTQIKKERKRLAKLQAIEGGNHKEIGEEKQRVADLKEKKNNEIKKFPHPQAHQQQIKKKNLQTQQQINSLSSNDKDSSSDKKSKIRILNSPSVSVTDKNKISKLPQMSAIKNSGPQKRSVSTTTSCSAATSTSSNNSISSQVNTRDNSVSSLRPLDLKKGNNKSNITKEQKIPGVIDKIIKVKSSHMKQKQKKQARIPPTPSTTSSDADGEESREVPKLKDTKSLILPAPISYETKTQQTQASKVKKTLRQKDLPKKLKSGQKPITPPSSNTEAEEDYISETAANEYKNLKPKFVDNGQFDNNPFKSLHMQDSDTEDENQGNEIDENPLKRSLEVVKLKQNNEVASKQGEGKTSVKKTATSLKNVQNELKKNKITQRSTSLAPGNKTVLNKPSKSNKSIKTQHPTEKLDQPASKKRSVLKEQQEFLEDECKHNNQTRNLKKNTQLNINSSNSRGTKCDNRPSNSSSASSQTKPSSKLASTSSNIRKEQTSCSTTSRNNNTNCSKDNRNQNKSDQIQTCGNVENKNRSSKRSQRNKKHQQKSQKRSLSSQHQNCCSSGIPNNMGYFNANEVNVTSSLVSHTQQSENNKTLSQNVSYQTLTDQMQALRLSGHQIQTTALMATPQQRQQHINSANVSIMDQLNRGVQVENLSLPPGITLTKVDPIKSEQLRQKSESIKKLSQPLQQQQQQQHQLQYHQQHLPQNTQTFHHSSPASTIIAPPITNPISSYYSSPYINVATAGIDASSGVIMVEANPPKSSNMSKKNMTTNCNGKQSKNKKRRNKSKANNNGTCPIKNSGSNENCNKLENSASDRRPKMITLRNPMFHSGSTAAAAAILQQPVMLPGRPLDGFPMPVPLPIDQPAAIIKNENGMYTIRNPALHQAVTNGLAIGGYRQFGGNVSYYTPQEAAAEAARATLQQQQKQKQQLHNENNENTMSSTTSCNNPSSSFSYFSSDTVQSNTPHNNISISCTTIGEVGLKEANNHLQGSDNCVGGLIGDAAIIQRPPSHQRTISAIGSEIKNAQQQKQKTKIEQQWSNFASDAQLPSNEKCCNTPFLSTVSESGTKTVVNVGGSCSGIPVSDLSLQEKYQQSKYYNGFDVFTGSGGGNSSSTANCAHIHHSCGDDSPPPSITGYNSYLEGIPNTGIIRYDDAAFLKNLIPGQNLNNEVSIHNVNDSNFARTDQATQAHHIEITPVYGSRTVSNQTNFSGNYRDPINDYSNDVTNNFPNNMHLNLNELETSMKYDFQKTSPTAVVPVTTDNSSNGILDFKDLLLKNGPTGTASHRTSPYLDENTLEGFVQNMNSLQVSNTSCEEQCSQLNGHCIGHGTTTATSSANNPANGWW